MRQRFGVSLSVIELRLEGESEELVVPKDLGDAVDAALRRESFPVVAALIPPYGYLGAARWEMASALPMVRVPDRLPAPAELGRVWRTVLVVKCPHRGARGPRPTSNPLLAISTS